MQQKVFEIDAIKVYLTETDDILHRQMKLTSRKLLKEALSQELPHKGSVNLDQLEIVNHTYLKSFPQFSCSLSHSHAKAAKKCGFAIALGSFQISPWIGIDLERTDRKLPFNWQRHILNSEEENLLSKLSPLEIWCAKEAGFKASSPALPAINTLKGISLFLGEKVKDPKNLNFKINHQDTSYLGQITLFNFEEWTTAVAWIRSSSFIPSTKGNSDLV